MKHLEVRPGLYRDSVRLMQISTTLGALPGVSRSLVAMATRLNLDLAQEMGFDRPEAGPNDLVVALEATSDGARVAALDRLEIELAGTAAGTAAGAPEPGGRPAARTTASAVAAAGANLVLISTPGRFAAVEAIDALDAGANVMVFSDNVPVAQEVALKRSARARGLLVLGPDCGTAVIGGVGLGFANVVRPGPVGLVAASGTGAQQVLSLLGWAGVGVSHCIGVGGRDLSAEVGGASTHAALDLLDADPATELIVLMGKTPSPEVGAAVTEHVARLATPVVLGWTGGYDLTATAEAVLAGLGVRVPAWPVWRAPAPAPAPDRRGRYLRGLFSGGTLCLEAAVIAAAGLGPIWSNVVTGGVPDGHRLLDLGDDEFTVGRPHPMIDFSLRLVRFAAEVRDPECGVLLLDVVLGHGAHPDPAGLLAPAISAALAARPDDLSIVVSLVGTRDDPQGLEDQAAALAAAGAEVFGSNAAAARRCVALLTGEPGPAPEAPRTPGSPPRRAVEPAAGTRPPDLLAGEPRVVTVGAEALSTALSDQAVAHVRVDWRPPHPGTEDALAVVMPDDRRRAANALAVSRMLAAAASIVDVRPAAEVVGLGRGEFCHAGPPIDWERASGPMRGALIAALLLEGLAGDPDEAARHWQRGRAADGTPLTLTPCHDRGGVGPMAGVVTPSMPVWVLRDEVHATSSWCTLNEGLGKVLRYGAYSPDVIERLRWMSEVLGPAFATALRAHGPVDVRAIIGQMVQMGDEGHNRNRAGTLMLLRDLLPDIVESGLSPAEVARLARFVGGNDHFFLNLVMPAAKLQTLAAAQIPGSTVVTVMARNGTDFGIQTSGTGRTWFTAPAGTPDGLFLGSYGPADANPDIGDSAITETVGLGGFAMAGAPAIVRFVGGSVADALRTTQEMYEITLAENPAYALPVLDFRGVPTGIDVTRVVRTRILPQINTGIAGKVAGTGQVGAGLVTPPMECFVAALNALAAAVTPTEDAALMH